MTLPADAEIAVLTGTRKGAFFHFANRARRVWTADGPHFLGQIVNHAVLDPRNGKTVLVAARAGHLGPTVFRSTDFGRNWKEAERPPAFAKDGSGAAGARAVSHVFWLAPGHATEPGVWYAGTSPHGLFRSDDDGVTWEGVTGFNDHPDREKWTGGPQDAPPDGGTLHSINVDPADARHIYIGMSAGGVFESRDAGATWTPLNRGCVADFLPDPDAAYGHDPHCVRVHPLHGNRVYQQNHCGIYALDGAADRWHRIGTNMPAQVGDIGFPMVLHPRDPDRLWVFPMDGTTVWPRMSVDGKPAVYRSNDAGQHWQRLDKGLPAEQAWFTVKRQAMCADPFDPAGIYFGTTSGEIWASLDEPGDAGGEWRTIARHLPHIYSLEAARVG